MYIKTYAILNVCFIKGGLYGAQPLLVAKIIGIPVRHSGIAGITRRRYVVLFGEMLIHNKVKYDLLSLVPGSFWHRSRLCQRIYFAATGPGFL